MKCAPRTVRRTWVVSLLLLSLFPIASAADVFSELMPGPSDRTQMWWADGFPNHFESARWLRVIQTGNFGFALNTESLTVEHFGQLSNEQSADRNTWQRLPPAKLMLTARVNGKSYRCVQGGRWSRYSGPRLIESGSCFQRADITGLVFQANDGEQLELDARFETAAWPDCLVLTLLARPALGTTWDDAVLEVELRAQDKVLRARWSQDQAVNVSDNQWHSVTLPISTDRFEKYRRPDISVAANDLQSNTSCPVKYDTSLACHRINLNEVKPKDPSGNRDSHNDILERVRLRIQNNAPHRQSVRVMFEKSRGGFHHKVGSPITGVSAILRDADGNPTGIPVQISKNWHNQREAGPHSGLWLHAFSQINLPPKAEIELELTICYGHWGGVPAASHAQLCLIGWGSNQHWSQSAIGAWGESVCFEPEQVQANCTVTDVRPLMVNAGHHDKQWKWTSNVGGADAIRFFDPKGERIAHSAVHTTYQRYGPCLTEVTFEGNVGAGITHSNTFNLARTDDVVRGTYRIRLDVSKPMNFSRLVLFQIGADTYSYTSERKMALGNVDGLIRQWSTQPGGNVYRTEPIECTQLPTWISLHDAVAREDSVKGAWANRGLVLRSWQARLGGKQTQPWIAERGLTIHRRESSTLDILPPPAVTRLEKGDFVEMTIEQIVVPQHAGQYYGPNRQLQAALQQHGNTWKMILREAVENNREIEVDQGTLLKTYPDIRVQANNDHASLHVRGGLGYVPITFTNLASHDGHVLYVDDQVLDQSIHGNDFWQTDYDPIAKRWSRTYNLPLENGTSHAIELIKKTNQPLRSSSHN